MKQTLLIVLVFSFFNVVAQQKITINELDSLQRRDRKNIIVFIHTNWCSYCKIMDERVFKNNNIAQLINGQYYYLLHLNAEDKTTFNFNNRVYKFKANKGYNALALELGNLNGSLSFPTLCILNKDYEILFQYNQFISARDLLPILQHFKNR